MKAFIVMPFAHRYNRVYKAVEKACDRADIMHLRANEIKQPGPIISQIFDSITNADCIIAEISDKNPNVYYEVGVAHNAGKPVILLGRKEVTKDLPFDIRHNRVLLYDEENPEEVCEKLIKYLIYLKNSITGKQIPTVDTHLDSLSFGREKSESLLESIITKDFGLIDAKIVEKKIISEGIIITSEGTFGERVTALIDVNGIIKRISRVSK